MIRWDRIPRYRVVGADILNESRHGGPCCICGTVWTTNKPMIDFSNFVMAEPYDVSACPQCGNACRARLLHYMQSTGALDFKGATILFFSPETQYEKQLCSDLSVSNKVLTSNQNSSHGYDANLDAADMPSIASESIDVVFFIHILEHIENDKQCLLELTRILKPGGILVIAVPSSSYPGTYYSPSIKTPEQRLRHYLWVDHLRLYGTDFAKTYIEPLGFSVKTYGASSCDSAWATQQRILSNEYVHYCRKAH